MIAIPNTRAKTPARTRRRSGNGPPAVMSRRELTTRLHEAEAALHAIRSGDVDAVVVDSPGGAKVFRLAVADHIYRVLVERMNEGAAVLSRDHTVLHCNASFARLLGAGLQRVVGASLPDRVGPDDRARLAALLRRGARRACRGEVHLQSPRGLRPVRLSMNPLRPGGTETLCVIAMDLSEVKRAEQELRATNEQLRGLSAHLLSVREEEQTRIARQVHDELGQSLTAVKLDLSWLAKRLPPGDGPARKKIRETVRLADATIRAVRRIATELRPGILDLGLEAAVEWQVHEFQTRTGIPCEVRLLFKDAPPPEVSTTIFRILQEALTNVARHAGATRVQVVLRKRLAAVILQVHDNGRGFDPGNPALSKSLGLLGMRERAAMLGGEVVLMSAPGKGASVTVRIPVLSHAPSHAVS